MTEPVPNEPVEMPPSAVGAVRTLIDWFRRELAAAWSKVETVSVGKTAADRRAREQEQRADRAERRLHEIESQHGLAMTWGREFAGRPEPHTLTCPTCMGSGEGPIDGPLGGLCITCGGECVVPSCESGCGPATRHDSEGVPLCEVCYQGLVDEARIAQAARSDS